MKRADLTRGETGASYHGIRRCGPPPIISLAGIAGAFAAAVDRQAGDRLAVEGGVHEVDATVLGLALGRGVVRDRLVLAEADGEEALAVGPLRDEPVRHRDRALLRERLVGGLLTVVVGVPLDAE